MIDKELIIKSFDKYEVNEALNVYEKMMLAYKKDIVVFTNSFYPPNIWSFFQRNLITSNLKIDTLGAFKDSERRMISFNNLYNENYPMIMLEINNKSNFSTLQHKDYLGALMSLGIEREKIGDVLVKDNRAYVPVSDGISNYIIFNLQSIGKVPVEINEITNIDILPNFDFKEEVIIIASLRIDSFVSKVSNISRTKALELIDNGKVLINYVRVKSKSEEISKDTRITVRGIGKFIVGDIVGSTKSGKQRVMIKKYT
ncbi:YlmH/Sll1252 family protein [Clostridium carnis]